MAQAAGVLAISVPGGGTSINFGAVPQGTAFTQTFTLSNTGNAAVSNITVAVNPANVGYSIDPPLPTMLAVGANATLTARFAPQSGSDGGPATVTFTGDTGATPPQTSAVLSLNGDGLSAGIAITNLSGMALTTLDFGNLRYNTTLTSKFCVVNPNETSATISPITIAPGTGTSSGEFTVTQVKKQTTCGMNGTNVTLPVTLFTGDVLEVTVRTAPANRTGAMQATLTVPTNLAATPTGTVALLANSTSGNFSLTPGATLDFGTVDVQVAAGSTKTITITNTGDGPLDLSSFSRTANAQFTLTLPGNTTLAPAQSLDIPVTYKPTTARPAGSEETITLSNSIGGDIDGPAMNTITIKGRGIDRVLSLGPAPTFPDTFRNPGDQAPVRSLKITNMGEATLKVTAAMITNDTDVWQLLDSAPIDIVQGATQDFRVRFSPKLAGSAPPATLMITHDDDMKPPVSVPLTGNGLDRNVQFGPSVIDLGLIPAGTQRTVDRAITLANLDSAHSIRVQRIVVDRPEFEVLVAPSLQLYEGSSADLSVRFSPDEIGEFETTVTLFLDEDPEPQATIMLRGRAFRADVHGGGGCATGRGLGGGAVLLVLAALLASRRRHAASVLAMIAVVWGPSLVIADKIHVGAFDPVPATATSGFQLESADIGHDGDWVASGVISFATNPMVIDVTVPGSETEVVHPISQRTMIELGGAYAFLGRFEAGLRMPFYSQTSDISTGDPMLLVSSASGAALGDLTLHAKARLVHSSWLTAGTALHVTFPTSTRDRFTGSDLPSVRVLGLASLTPTPWLTLSANGGPVLRKTASYGDPVFIQQGSGLSWGAGASLHLVPSLSVTGEVFGELIPKSNRMAGSLSPIEGLVGAAYRIERRVTVGAAIGRGISNGLGAPDLRGTLTLSFAPGAPELPKPPRPRIVDTDGDGIPDNKDKCPNEPEDRNGIRDDDGCPDADADHDGIVDVHDKCPQQPEDRDGFQDEDGCPDPDNDGDGIPDPEDLCPMQPETINGIDDDDGCPDSGGDTGTQIGVAPNQSPVQAAEATFQRGRKLVAEKKYFAACASFEQSQRLDPRTGTKYNLALCYTEIGKLATALSMFRELAQIDKDAERRADSKDRAADLTARVPKLKLSLVGTPTGVNVYMNGTNVNALIGIETPIDFGTYTIVAGAPGYRGWRQTIEVKKDGEIVPVDIDLGPPMKP